MQRTTFARMLLALLAVAALALSGCGGDDGLSAEDQARIDIAVANSAEAQANAEAAEAEAAAAEAAAEAAAARIAELEKQLEDAESADEITMLQQQIADLLMVLAEEPEPTPDPGYQPGDPGGTLEGQEGRAAAARVERAYTRKPFEVELLDRNLTTDPQTAATPVTDNDAIFPADTEASPARVRIATGVSITKLKQARLGYPAELTLSVEGGTGLTTAMDSADTDAPAITGFTGVSLMKDGPGPITQTALVYADAERSVRAWGDVYEYTVTSIGGATPAATEALRTHLSVTSAPITDVTKIAVLDPNIEFEHGLSTTLGLTQRVHAVTTTIRGSYDGASGQYVCNTSCTIALDAEGDVTFVGGGPLTFRADNAESLLDDTDYLAFGVWTEVPDSPTLGNPGRTRAFVDASATVYKYRHLGDLAGTASYSGGAVGHYATRAQGAHTAEMGRFTAKASLTANFDGGAAGLLSGKIDSFMSEDGAAMPGWVVNLRMGNMVTGRYDSDAATNDPVTDPVDFDATDLTFARPSTDGDIYGLTSGTTGALSWGGHWDAWMFGNNLDAHPTGVAGRFAADGGTAVPATTAEGRINLFEDEGFAGVVGSFAGR